MEVTSVAHFRNVSYFRTYGSFSVGDICRCGSGKKRRSIYDRGRYFYSKEPSVKYRGFFINDEWPAFGNWTFSHFGGFTAEMYDMIFETLLRHKGKLPVACNVDVFFFTGWTGEQNAILADEYGVVMSNSHHEPCLRHRGMG